MKNMMKEGIKNFGIYLAYFLTFILLDTTIVYFVSTLLNFYPTTEQALVVTAVITAFLLGCEFYNLYLRRHSLIVALWSFIMIIGAYVYFRYIKSCIVDYSEFVTLEIHTEKKLIMTLIGGAHENN